jgi:hypothetical protein
MHSAGLAAFEARDPARTNRYAFEQGEIALDATSEKQFRADVPAWTFFHDQPHSYRKPAIWWVISAKKEETRQRRLVALIGDSREGRRLAHLVSPARKARS